MSMVAALAAVAVFAMPGAALSQDEVAATAPSVDVAQVARGAKAWANTCARCHNVRAPKEFGDASWDTIVAHMRVVGPIPGQDARDIAAFLKASN